MQCPLHQLSYLHPNSIALETQNASYTFKELEIKVQKATATLKSTLGSFPSKFFILKAPLHANTLIVYLASARLRLVPCLIHPKESAEKIANLHKDLDTPYCIDPLEISFSDITSEHQPTRISKHFCCLLLTSGTTGQSKYAALSFLNFYYNYKGLHTILGLSSSSRYLLTLPLNHVSGLSILYRALFARCTIVLADANVDLATLLEQKCITHCSLVSLQLQRLIESFQKPLPYLKSILLGGGPTRQDIIRKALSLNLPIFQSYGMTETASTIACQKLASSSADSCGHPLLYRKIFLTQHNEVCISGKTLFLGYYHPTYKTISRPKQFKTQDLARYHHKRGLKIVGRKDNVMIIKGENISAEEIEAALLKHPSVEYACVVAQETSGKDVEIAAFIKTTSDACVISVHNFIKSQLPSIKIPKHVYPWPKEIPPTTSSKIPRSLRDVFFHLACSKTLSSS